MKNDIFTTLKGLKSIKPDSEYTKQSKMLILSLPQNEVETNGFFTSKRIVNIARFAAAIGVVVFVFVSLMGSVFYINKNYSPLALEGLNQNSLTAEADEINHSIEITLGEISYLDQSNQKVTKTLNEVSKNATAAAVMKVASSETSTAATSSIDVKSFLIQNNPSSTDEVNNALDALSK